jgi:hypothetical protein
MERKMPRRHVVIAGTGRSGTSFLVELLTHLGLDTGYPVELLEKCKSKLSRAGLESDIRRPDAPYVIKNPLFCEYAEEILSRDDIIIEHVFIPMRDLKAATESRRLVTSQAMSQMPLLKRVHFHFFPEHIDGGLTTTDENQEQTLLRQSYQLFLALSRTNVPATLMRYPKIVQEPVYLYQKLSPILGEISLGEFESVFRRVSRQDLVHSYNNADK